MNGSLLRGRLQVRILPGSPLCILIIWSFVFPVVAFYPVGE